MGNVSIKFNEAEFRRKFQLHIDSDPRLKSMVDNFAKRIFLRAKDALLKEFDNHPITLELEEGVESSNLSGTLNEEGNLFAFLGFFENQHPTEELRQLLNNITIQRTVRRNNNIYYRVNVPSKDMIVSATEMNWGSGTSWAYAVENGDFNGDAALSHFIFKTWENGRSQQGLQVKGYDYSEEEFNSMPYITEILNNFRDRINGNV